MKKFFSKAKAKVTALFAGAALAVTTAVSASALDSSGIAKYSEQIKGEFQNAADGIMPIIIGILGIGLGIFAIFKGIKLAKRMFGTVSNG